MEFLYTYAARLYEHIFMSNYSLLALILVSEVNSGLKEEYGETIRGNLIDYVILK